MFPCIYIARVVAVNPLPALFKLLNDRPAWAVIRPNQYNCKHQEFFVVVRHSTMTTGVQFCGDRVIIAKHRATVRYVGPVDGHEGLWVGVEWDDPSRGKHDGATGGRRYFTCCSAAPTAASFVRINKVTEGTSLVDALVMRYTNQLAEGQGSTADAAQQAYVSTASNKKLWVQLVGQDKVTERQSKLELLTSARLVGANVSTVVSGGEGMASARDAMHAVCWHALLGMVRACAMH